jgi:alpha-beta hydrolase superfamily lysophospholipase
MVGCAGAALPPQIQSQVKVEKADRATANHRILPLTRFYDTPNPLPGKNPGDLIRSEEFDEYILPEGVRSVRILYHSRSASGQDVAVSGVVLYPDAIPPAGGWPVLAWAHRLNGVARECAPSLARNLQHGPFLAMYVSQGYAVVATDYAGLGTSSRSAFSDTASNATDVIHSVPAARSAVPQLGSRWIAVGIGQGGAAAVGVAELQYMMRDPGYLGSIAISGLEDASEGYARSATPSFHEAPLWLAYGIKSVYPDFNVKEILTDRALAVYPRVEQTCEDPAGASKLSRADLLKTDWANDRFVKQYFSRSALGSKPAQGPLLIISSELDTAIPIQQTAQVIARMCKQGDRVQFEKYPQSDPGAVFGDSVRDQIAWIQGRFAARPASSNCAEQR